MLFLAFPFSSVDLPGSRRILEAEIVSSAKYRPKSLSVVGGMITMGIEGAVLGPLALAGLQGLLESLQIVWK